MATWAFGNGNRFDLLAVPRLSGVALDGSYVDPDGGAAPVSRTLPLAWVWIGAVAIGLIAVIGVGIVWRGGVDEGVSVSDPVAPVVNVPVPSPPLRNEVGESAGPGERRRAAEALSALADRFGVTTGDEASSDPSALMERFAREVRYRGPFLSAADRARLGHESGHDAGMAMRWDAHARRFADDRPLPDDFRFGPLRWQLDVLAWSFHGESSSSSPTPSGVSAAEVVQALGESLAVDTPLRPTPLSARYPALSSYLTFLGRLPRR